MTDVRDDGAHDCTWNTIEQNETAVFGQCLEYRGDDEYRVQRVGGVKQNPCKERHGEKKDGDRREQPENDINSTHKNGIDCNGPEADGYAGQNKEQLCDEVSFVGGILHDNIRRPSAALGTVKDTASKVVERIGHEQDQERQRNQGPEWDPRKNEPVDETQHERGEAEDSKVNQARYAERVKKDVDEPWKFAFGSRFGFIGR